MAKRQTKADVILNDSAMRLEAARIRVSNAQSELNSARATRDALQEAHNALEKALAPKPRKKTAKPPAAQEPLTLVPPDPPGADEDKGPLCGICGNKEDYQDHFKPSPNYHPFESPVVPVEKKSRRKTGGTSIIPSGLDGTNDATAVAASGGD